MRSPFFRSNQYWPAIPQHLDWLNHDIGRTLGIFDGSFLKAVIKRVTLQDFPDEFGRVAPRWVWHTEGDFSCYVEINPDTNPDPRVEYCYYQKALSEDFRKVQAGFATVYTEDQLLAYEAQQAWEEAERECVW